MERVATLRTAYESWVRENAPLVRSLDESSRTISLMVPDRYGEHELFSESIATALNLVSFYHEKILGLSSPLDVSNQGGEKGSVLVSSLKSVLVAVQHTQVLLEMLSRRVLQGRGRWLCVLMVELSKAVLRASLLYLTKSKMLTRKDGESPTAAVDNNGKPLDDEFADLRAMYRRSGRGEDRHGRYSDSIAVVEEMEDQNEGTSPRILVSECVSIARPVLHVLGILAFRQSSWTPFVLSAAMDTVAMSLLRSVKLTQSQVKEVQKRKLLLLLYMFRSPFFEQFTRVPLLTLCRLLERLPLLGLLFTNIIELLQHLRTHHFYTSPY